MELLSDNQKSKSNVRNPIPANATERPVALIGLSSRESDARLFQGVLSQNN